MHPTSVMRGVGQVLVRDHMTPDPVTITPQNTIADAFALLRDN